MKEMVGGCCVCSDEHGWHENPLVYCDGPDCSVAVHQACYGIVSVPTGPWFCERCEAGETSNRSRCDLCPMQEGAFKRTDRNGWAHVVCALYIPEVQFGNVRTMDPIILSQVPPDRFSKVCYICEEKGMADKASFGACMQCNRNGCKMCFHVTCAQQEGLLCEESGAMDNIKYCGYCGHHFKKLKKGDPTIKAIPPYRPVSTPSSTNSVASDGSTYREKVSTNSAKNAATISGNHSSTNNNNNHHSSNSRENCIKSSSNSKSIPVPTPSSSLLPSSVAPYLSHTTAISVPPISGGQVKPAPVLPIGQQLAATSNPGTNSFSSTSSIPCPQPLPSGSRTFIPVDGGSDTASSTWTKPVPQISYLGFNNDVLHSNTSGHIVGGATAANPLAPAITAAAPTVGGMGLNVLTPMAAISSVIPPSGFAGMTVSTMSGGSNGHIGPGQPKHGAIIGAGTASNEDSIMAPASGTTGTGSGSKSGKTSASSGSHKRKSDSREAGAGGSNVEADPATEKPKKPRRNSTKAKNMASLLDLVSPVVQDTITSFQMEKVASQRSDVFVQQRQPTIQQQPSQLSSIDSIIAATAAGYQSSQLPSTVLPERPGISVAPAPVVLPESAVVEQAAISTPIANIVCPPAPPPKSTPFRSPQETSLTGSSTFPTSLDQLLERQWEQGSQFLMEQAQHFDIASLLSCLHQLKVENQRLEDHVVSLSGRRDHLLAVNARLSIPLGQQHHSPNSPRVNASAPIATPFLHLQTPSSQDSSQDISEPSVSARLSAPPNTSTPIALHTPFIGAPLIPVVTSSKAVHGATAGSSSNNVVSPTSRSALGSLTAAVAAPNFSMVPGGSVSGGGVFASVKNKSSQEASPERQQQQQATGSFLIPRAPTPMLPADFIRPQTSPLISSQYPLAQDPRMLYQLMQQNVLAAYGNAYGLIQSTSPHRATAASVFSHAHLVPHTGAPPSTQEKG